MSSIAEDIRIKMMHVLREEEEKTDLEDLAVLSRVGMKVASAFSSDLDADATSASSTALIDLGLRLSQATAHGALMEIILHNTLGYSILQAINEEYVVFAGLKNVYRIGYYLGYLRELVKKLGRLISGDQETDMVFSLEEPDVRKPTPQEVAEKSALLVKPSLEQDKAALDDLLGFLDDWEKEGADFEELEPTGGSGVVSIPKTVSSAVDSGIKQAVAITPSPESQFQVYEDEVPPIPLDDYTPMEIEDEPISEQAAPIPEEPVQPSELSSPIEDFPTPESMPSFDDLTPPDFDTEFSASEYDTEYVLEEESEALDSVLKDLGWDQEEDQGSD